MSVVPQNQASKTPRTPAVGHTPPEPAGDTIEWLDPSPQRPGRSTGLLVVAITATLLALGLGYLTREQWLGRQSALAALATTNTQLQALTKEHTQVVQNAGEQRELVAEQTQQLEQDASELTDLKTQLGAAEARLSELETQSEALNEHLSEFRALTKQFQRMIDSGKLEIGFRRGRMIVELPAAVLFASGSAELSTEGRHALQEIAKILRQVPGKRFMVGGHTDDVPIGKGSTPYSSNWSLSAARAVMVTEALIQSGLRANHLVAAGYGEHDPIASNGTEKGRLKNRRIEIVLEPDLAKLPNALADLKAPAAAPAKKKKK